VRWLRGQGYDATSIYEIARGATDHEILARAYRENRVVVTADEDFGDLIYRDGHPHRGVILLRLDDESAGNIIRVLSDLLAHHADQMEDHFIVVTESGVRISPSQDRGQQQI
jgi:predicted nuclease of predicted toxin-antitoxin system